MTKITKQDIEQMLYDLTGNDKSARGSVDYTMFILNQYMLSEVLELIGEDVVTDPTPEIPEGVDETYDIQCYNRIGANDLRDELRNSLKAIKERWIK